MKALFIFLTFITSTTIQAADFKNDFDFDSVAAVNYVVAYAKFDRRISWEYKNYIEKANTDRAITGSRKNHEGMAYIFVGIPSGSSDRGIYAVVQDCSPLGTFTYQFVLFSSTKNVDVQYKEFMEMDSKYVYWGENACIENKN